jgi:peptide/nickel transport system substrate-binding protein
VAGAVRGGKVKRRDLLRRSAALGATSLIFACVPPPQGTTPTGAGATEAPQTRGRFALGPLEGGEVITDAARFPRTFKEAPELAALVQQGKLPPVADRVGQDPLVIKPVHGIGTYGGTLRRAFTGGVFAAGIHQFAQGPASLLYVDYKWSKIVPNIAREFEQSSDGKTLTIRLRRGMKWSDGAPFTADDILFWYEDLYGNKQLFPGKSPELVIDGKDVVIEKVDQYTVRFLSPSANRLLVERVASPLSDLGGPYFRGQLGRGGYAPKHYLSKIHPKYAAGGQAAVDRMAADAKFNSWVSFFHDRNNWRLNTELPVLTPWKVTVPASNPTQLVLERNPFSIWVDTEGNQLPYIGTIRHLVAENNEVVALRATAGEYDFQDQVLDVGKLPVLVDAQARGGYKLLLDPQEVGIGIVLNLAYEEDREVGDLLRNVDFRRALSMGVDRTQINEAIFLGTGIPSASLPSDGNKFFPGNDWRTKWATLDLAQANTLLDKIGLTQKDNEGYRLRRDGTGRLRLSFLAVQRITDFGAIAEMLKQHWQKIGIELVVEPIANALLTQRLGANNGQMTGNLVGSEHVFLQSATVVPDTGGVTAMMGLPYAQWKASGGTQGKEPFPAIKQIMDLLERGKTASENEQIEIGKEIARMHVDQVFTIGIVQGDVGNSGVRLAKTNLANVPGRIINAVTLQSGNNALAQTFHFR